MLQKNILGIPSHAYHVYVNYTFGGQFFATIEIYSGAEKLDDIFMTTAGLIRTYYFGDYMYNIKNDAIITHEFETKLFSLYKKFGNWYDAFVVIDL